MEELLEGRSIRAEHDGELHEGRITALDDEDGMVVLFVEARGEHLTVPAEAVRSVRRSAFERLLEVDEDLAFDLLEEDLVALTGPEDVASLFETHMNLTSHKMAAARRRSPLKSKGVTARVATARPNVERFSAFIRTQRAGAASAHRLMRRAARA